MNGYSAHIVVEKKANINYKMILGEMKEHKRSGIVISETKDKLEIVIKTKDATALRASMNAIMRDIQAIEGATTAK